jgi:hypothetical protein
MLTIIDTFMKVRELVKSLVSPSGDEEFNSSYLQPTNKCLKN